MYSSRLKILEKRASELRKRFLPKKFSSTGLYTPEQLDYCRAYRVLVHAEIEHFLEERALDIANLALNIWLSKQKATLPLMSCIANMEGDHGYFTLKKGHRVTLNQIAGKAFGQYNHIITNNHGIKEENIRKILLPIGVPETDIDVVWLSTIDGFGAKRGATAHTSSITHTIDPKDELNTVNDIIAGLKDIDVVINNIKSKLK